jgi:hypothetical protein
MTRYITLTPKTRLVLKQAIEIDRYSHLAGDHAL